MSQQVPHERSIPKAKAAEEMAFVRRQLDALKTQRVKLPDSHSPPEPKRARRAPICQIPLGPAPEPLVPDESTEGGPSNASSSSITLNIVSAKPPLSYTLQADLNTSIGALKANLSSEHGDSAPSVDAQRWLLGGKALVDAKLLREYDQIVKAAEEGPIKINLFVKAGWTPGSSASTTTSTPVAAKTPDTTDSKTIPQLTVEPSSAVEGGQRAPGTGLIVDTTPQSSHAAPKQEDQKLVAVVSEPTFWLDVHAMLIGQLGEGEDSRRMFETWFNASKNLLTPSQIAKIRDQVGLTGLAGN